MRSLLMEAHEGGGAVELIDVLGNRHVGVVYLEERDEGTVALKPVDESGEEIEEAYPTFLTIAHIVCGRYLLDVEKDAIGWAGRKYRD